MAVWSIPVLLVLQGIVWLVGGFSPSVLAAATALTLIYVVYFWMKGRSLHTGPKPIANVVALYPGHLLLLIALSLVPASSLLGAVWCALPVATMAYDVATRRPNLVGRRSILAGLYCIIWAVVFFLLEQAIVLGKDLSGSREITAAIAVGAIGILFCGTGIYRHRRAVKE
jgi:hypothetical protein